MEKGVWVATECHSKEAEANSGTRKFGRASEHTIRWAWCRENVGEGASCISLPGRRWARPAEIRIGCYFSFLRSL